MSDLWAAEVTVPAALFYGIHLDVQVRM